MINILNNKENIKINSFFLLSNLFYKINEKLINKQNYEKASFFSNLSSYSSFFSKNFYKFLIYKLILKKNMLFQTTNFLLKIKFYSLLSFFFKDFKINKKKKNYLLNFLKFIKNKCIIFNDKKIIINNENYVFPIKKNIFCFSKKCLLINKFPIFNIESVFYKFIKKYFLKDKKYFFSYNLIKNLYTQQKILKSSLNYEFYIYLLFQYFTFIEIENFKNKNFFYYSILIFRNFFILKILKFNQKTQLILDFFKIFKFQKNIRLYKYFLKY